MPELSTAPAKIPTKVHVAIVGAGASGVVLASALVRPPAMFDVALIDPEPGGGPAYGGSDEGRPLNTRVGMMSLDPRSPAGFRRFLELRHPREEGWNDDDFAPRPFFGAYLKHRLQTLQDRTPGLGSTQLVRDQVVAASRGPDGWTLRLKSGRRIEAAVVVLATGSARPRPLIFHGRDAIEAYVQDDPWDEAALASLPRGGRVLLVGTGLTAMDVACALLRRDPEVQVVAVSRHGLLPRMHASPAPGAPALKPPYPTTARELYAKLRAAAEFVEGDRQLRHGVFLNLRDIGAEIWAGLPQEERAMFLRHFRRYWDVERHRLPPAQSDTIARAIIEERLELVRGRVAEAKALKSGRDTRVALLSSSGPLAIDVRRVINCTGPEPDVFRSRNPLLLDLLAQGLVSADPLGLGLEVDADGAALAGDGQVTPGLFALGPPTLGRFFEVSQVAQIRDRAERLAELIIADRAAPALAPQGHFASGGIELRIDSTLPPVFRPKVVPRS